MIQLDRLFSLEGLLCFVAGSVATYAYMCWRMNMTHHADGWHKRYPRLRLPRFRRTSIAWVLIFGGLLWIGWQNEKVRDQVVDLTARTVQCQKEFQDALAVRSKITQENDVISVYQRELIYNWMHALVFPPPEIDSLDPNHPRREEWAIELTRTTDAAFAASIDQQRANDRERAENPLPPPNCPEGT